jgi:hypothetical protein
MPQVSLGRDGYALSSSSPRTSPGILRGLEVPDQDGLSKRASMSSRSFLVVLQLRMVIRL